jgi:pentatricopeptide repeat protein
MATQHTTTLPSHHTLLFILLIDSPAHLTSLLLSDCLSSLSLSWFVRVYSHAPLGTYHQMMRAASRFQQYLRVDEYFKLLLRFHQPVPETFNILLAAHAQAGHTNRVLEILEQMQQGSTELVKKHMPTRVLKLQQEHSTLQLPQSTSYAETKSNEEENTSDSSSSSNSHFPRYQRTGHRSHIPQTPATSRPNCHRRLRRPSA